MPSAHAMYVRRYVCWPKERGHHHTTTIATHVFVHARNSLQLDALALVCQWANKPDNPHVRQPVAMIANSFGVVGKASNTTLIYHLLIGEVGFSLRCSGSTTGVTHGSSCASINYRTSCTYPSYLIRYTPAVLPLVALL